MVMMAFYGYGEVMLFFISVTIYILIYLHQMHFRYEMGKNIQQYYVNDSLTGLTLSHLCDCPKLRVKYPT
jgi:predicted membrane protein